MEDHRFISYANGKSLVEINSTIPVPRTRNFFRMLLAYTSLGALVAVGYMDPGNRAASINGGQSFNYLLISTILISSLMAAMLLENSQVFLAFAVPFSIVPLLIMTDDKRMMGQFKNRKI